jgi:protocatechuate 3,4-dioxygenase beta subunit
MQLRPSRRSSSPLRRDLDRRGFLGFVGGSVVALGAAACVGEDALAGGGAAGGAGKADNLVFGADGVCLSGATGDDALGPYWTADLKQTSQLADPTEPGQRLVVMGHVFARDCTTPIPGATVVAWQANDAGLYDYNLAGLDQGSSQGQLAAAQTRLRGRFTTSPTGTYAIETIVPSEYPLDLLDPASSAFRAPHIHFAVFWTDGGGGRHQLVTQMYFAPSALMLTKVPDLDQLNADDGGASTAEASRFVELGGRAGGVWHGEFDIVLDVDPAAV